MPADLWTQLAEREVPEVPERFDLQVHQRVNRWLLLAQLADLALRGVPQAMWLFARSVFGLLIFTLSGSYHSKNRKD